MIDVSLSPEIQAVICCARVQPTEASQHRLRSLLTNYPIDWPTLVDLARRHALTPLLYRNLKRYAPELVPAETLADLGDEFYRNGWLTQHLSRGVADIVTLLGAHDIRVIPIKGVALAQNVYGQPSLRHTGDIDILVSPVDALAAKRILVEAGGFTAAGGPNSPAEEALLIRNAVHLSLARPGLRTGVELHWRLTPRRSAYRTDFEQLWHRRTSFSLAGTPVAGLGPVDQLHFLCLHGTRHQWSSLRWVTDVAELILGQPDFAWAELLGQVYAARTRRPVWVGLYLARRLLGAPLPPDIWAEINHTLVRNQHLIRQTYSTIFAPTVRTPHQMWENFLFDLTLEESLKNRLRFLKYTLAPYNNDRRSFALPVWLHAVYYLLRPFQFGWKYLRSQPWRPSQPLDQQNS